jgi:AI-2E family transporter
MLMVAVATAGTDLVARLKINPTAIIVGIVTLFYSFPADTIIWAIVVIVYQQIENNILSPIVYRRTVQVSGMLVLISVLIGATLGGVIGALLAIPVAAAMQIVGRDVWQQHQDGSGEAPAQPVARATSVPADRASAARRLASRGTRWKVCKQSWPDQLGPRDVELARLVDERLMAGVLEADELLRGCAQCVEIRNAGLWRNQ